MASEESTSAAARFYMGVEHNECADLGSAFDEASASKFDFIVVPLLHESAEGCAELILPESRWVPCVAGSVSRWVHLDSRDQALRRRSEVAFQRQTEWAVHMSLPAILLPQPGRSCANLARHTLHLVQRSDTAKVWVRVPLLADLHEKAAPTPTTGVGASAPAPLVAMLQEAILAPDGPSAPAAPGAVVGDDTPAVEDDDRREGDAEAEEGAEDDARGAADVSWANWNQLRALCEHHPRVTVALQLSADLPPRDVLDRWKGEPVSALILPTDIFLTNKKGFPVLTRAHQDFVISMFDHDVQFVISGKAMHPLGHAAYLQYIAYLSTLVPDTSPQRAFERPYFDYLQVPLQPLQDNLESQVYETFERDPVKYTLYEEAMYQALKDRRATATEEVPVVIMVVGAGRGPIVTRALRAGERALCPVRVFALDKNPNAIMHLRQRQREEWGDLVTVYSGDMRAFHTQTDARADLLVSELLGSFGDNELSPECLDGAQALLAEGGISIPYEYTSFVAPIMSSKLWNAAKQFSSLKHMETPYVVRMHSFASLSPPQPCFSFQHPTPQPADNSRYCELEFPLMSPCTVHGFAGYFECRLYGDVLMSINPPTHSDGMFSWFPAFFPLRTPLHIREGKSLRAHFWRQGGNRRVWYEWAVTQPTPTPIHNPNGRSYFIGL